ncbi:MAG: DUF72 domain-containing protein [Candidatus Dormibacteria bacterium]
MAVAVGTSGWQYRSWRGRLYAGVPQRAWLPHYAARFATVELNTTFYSLPRLSSVEGWAATTPEDFCFAAKASRYLTHLKRLREPEPAVAVYLERLEPLIRAGKLGPILIQLPPNFAVDCARLEGCLAAFPRGLRLAVEVRHPSWFCPEVRTLLERRDVPLCLSDRRGLREPEWRTASWGYVRFHEGRAAPWSCYGPGALSTWAERVARLWPTDEDVFVYFNNDPNGCAPRDAQRFAKLCSGGGLSVTRVPVEPMPVGEDD